MDSISKLASCHPKFRGKAQILYDDMRIAYQANVAQFSFEIFESLRSPAGQDAAFKKGVSKARAWQSPHQFGLACDFVPYLNREQAKALGKREGWYWPDANHPDWKLLTTKAHILGLVTISWDKPHVEDPIFRDLRDLLDW